MSSSQKTPFRLLLLFLSVLSVGSVSAEISLKHLDGIDQSSKEYSTLKSWVDRALGGNAGWGYKATDALYVYYITKDQKYLTHAIEVVDAFVASEEASISAGSSPTVDNDSYLHVGVMTEPVSLAYSLGADLLSNEQRVRWSAYMNQTIYNVWNNSSAEWGGNRYTWSGWASSNPDNNYYYSFSLATALWALASNDSSLMTQVREDIFPKINVAMAALPGGGSVEGTGYGVSHRVLFRLYHYWLNTLGEEVDTGHSHTRDSIDYWVHATTPDFTHYAPIGDQARTSTPGLYYYHAHVVKSAVYIESETEQAKRGRWWLGNIDIDPWQRMARELVYNTEGESSTPNELTYFAEGLGHFFARSSWQRNALWFSSVAGRGDESHAHLEHGAFTLYKEGFLTVTGNVGSNGIQQGTDRHNIIRFEKDGSLISQNRNNMSVSSPVVADGISTVNMSLGSMYDSNDVRDWQRELTFDGKSLRVVDVCDVSSDVTPYWQINVPVEPVLDSNVITAGELVITINNPEAPNFSVESWSVLAGESNNSSWRISVQGEQCAFDVKMDVLFVDSPPNPPSGFGAQVIQ